MKPKLEKQDELTYIESIKCKKSFDKSSDCLSQNFKDQAPTQKPFIYMSPTPLQSLLRGFLCRKANPIIISATPSLPPLAIPVQAQSLLSQSTQDLYNQLPPFLPYELFLPAIGLPDGSLYRGQTSKNIIPHGPGQLFSSDGCILEGTWDSGDLSGAGRLITPKADLYTGNFSEGLKDGQGKIQYFNSSSYEGEWFQDLQHGHGSEVWQDGSKFEGFYLNGLKNGKGKFSWPDGSFYSGEFVNDQLEGQGTFVWNNRRYEGQWKGSKMNGKGKFEWSDGKAYEGDYLNDQKHGFGVFVWPNGKKYEGYWVEGKQHGQGVIWNKGIGKVGVWECGKLISLLSE